MAENNSNKSKRNGDVLFMTESGNFSSDASSHYFRALEDGYTQSNISDGIRLALGSFWCASGSEAQRLYKDKYPSRPPITSVDSIGIPVTDEKGTVTEELLIKFHERGLDNWSHVVSDMISSGTANYDHTVTLNAFEQGSNLEEESSGVANHYARVGADYNFLEEEYEEVIHATNAPEPILPGFYNFLLKDQSPTLESRLGLRYRISIPPSQPIDGQNTFKPVSNYYRQWASNFRDYQLDRNYASDVSDMEHVVFTKDEMSLLSDLYKHRNSFPMFTTSEFTTDNNSVFGDTLERTSFSSKLNEHIDGGGESRSVIEVLSKKGNSLELPEVRVIPGTKKFSDVKDFFESYTLGTTRANEFFFNDNIRQEGKYKAYYNLMSVIAQGKLTKMAKSYTRTYKDILDGKKARTETIAYVLTKYDQNGNQIQSYRFPNTSKVDVIRFVDSQVKYDKRYTYKIKCRNIVFGTEYSIVDSDGDLSRTNNIRIIVESKPSIKIVEFDLFEKSVLLSDNPPIAPEVLIVPLKNISDRVRILMNTGIGRHMASPIVLSPDEATKIERYKIAQDLPSEATEIKYETDDTLRKFCVYKTDKKPTSYMDFLEYGEEMNVPTKGTSSSIEDKIEPNKKYYYFVRAEDYHGNKSFPSTVYEVTMVSDTGSVYPIIKAYEFKEPVTKQPSIGVKRFINIKPSRENLFVNNEAMGTLDSDIGGPMPGDTVVLGINDNSMWNKKFKIRLTSKSTGKKVDFNFLMKYQTKNERNEES